jgi:POT family proton-dependent oligopeptide transporter
MVNKKARFVQEKTFAHPPSLRTFFATELWERYGFYVVQTLLALYLALHFKWPDKSVYDLVGSFTALTYISPVIGGWIADHLLGQKRAILTGAFVLLGGYLAISLSTTDQGLTASLAAIAVGTGLLKPNISSLLGNEYPIGSPNRENGFTIFYMGLTTGIILGTTLPSYINHFFGWSVSFLSAAIGIIVAIITFSIGIKRHRIQDYHPFDLQLKNVQLAALLMIMLWIAAFYILNYPRVADSVFIIVALSSLSYLLYCVKCEKGVQARQTLVILLLCIISVMFWAFYFQMFLSLTLFIARVVQPTLFGILFPPPYYVGVQSVGMILIGFLLVRYKSRLNHRRQNINTGNKFLMAMVLTTITYTIIVFVARTGGVTTLLSPLYILPAYLMLSLAELLLSPVGLSAITILASQKKVSTMMGIFFVSLGIGAFLSGKLAKITAIPLGDMSTSALKVHYAKSFSQLLYILIVATLFCIVLNWIIRRLMTATTGVPDH